MSSTTLIIRYLCYTVTVCGQTVARTLTLICKRPRLLWLLALNSLIILVIYRLSRTSSAVAVSSSYEKSLDAIVATTLRVTAENITVQVLHEHATASLPIPKAQTHQWSVDARQLVERGKDLMRVREINCLALFSGSKTDLDLAKNITKTISNSISDVAYVNLTSNCTWFQNQRGYIMSSLSEEEKNFPLAFSILVFKDTEMVERLLRAIYRPQNFYCVHVDSKSTDVFYNSIKSIVKCFPNVFITPKRVDVRWGRFSVLEPELMCMEELWKYPGWKYFMTLTGQEFPLKTNLELVKILTAYDGANDLEGTIKRANRGRWRTGAPAGIRPVKGSVHITVNRDYVDYVLHNETAKTLLEWVKRDTSFPDETYFATLNHNPQLGIRGSYKGEPETDEERKPFLTRYKNWGHLPCASGNFVRTICILSLGDLPQLGQAKHLFANKFYLWEDRVVVGCLEEKIFNDTRDEFLALKNFDVSYYSNLDFVKNKV